MADIFGRQPINLKTPITADACTIYFSDTGIVGQAISFSMEYSQSITRRRTIGSQDAILYGSQPVGRATMARLITAGANEIIGNAFTCNGSSITFNLGNCDGDTGQSFTANGCIVTSFSIQAQAEDLTVMDNVTIEFMELVHD